MFAISWCHVEKWSHPLHHNKNSAVEMMTTRINARSKMFWQLNRVMQEMRKIFNTTSTGGNTFLQIHQRHILGYYYKYVVFVAEASTNGLPWSESSYAHPYYEWSPVTQFSARFRDKTYLEQVARTWFVSSLSPPSSSHQSLFILKFYVFFFVRLFCVPQLFSVHSSVWHSRLLIDKFIDALFIETCSKIEYSARHFSLISVCLLLVSVSERTSVLHRQNLRENTFIFTTTPFRFCVTHHSDNAKNVRMSLSQMALATLAK